MPHRVNSVSGDCCICHHPERHCRVNVPCLIIQHSTLLLEQTAVASPKVNISWRSTSDNMYCTKSLRDSFGRTTLVRLEGILWCAALSRTRHTVRQPLLT